MFQVLLFNTNDSIRHHTFICTQLNRYKYCYAALIIQFNISRVLFMGYIYIYIYKRVRLICFCPVGWGCRINRVYVCWEARTPNNECPEYNTKWFDGEAPVIQELWGMWSTPSLQLLAGPLWSGLVVFLVEVFILETLQLLPGPLWSWLLAF